MTVAASVAPASGLQSPPPMRARTVLPMFLAALAACAPLRHAAPPAAPSAPLVPSPPPALRDDLGVLDHTSVDAWEERLRADPRLRQQTEIGRAACRERV